MVTISVGNRTGRGTSSGGARRLLSLMAVVALLAVGCGDDDDDVAESTGATEATDAPDESGEEEASEPEGDGEAAAEEVMIEIVSVSEGFQPASVTVAAGTEVTWMNTDSLPHTSTAEDGTWDSGNLDSGEEFSFPTEEPGTYPYICSIHPSMQGELVVE